MTEEVAALEPLVYLDGQPISREQAGARRQELMADPDYGEAAAGGDMVKVAELTKLWRIEHGMTPEPVPPANPDDVRKSMTDRDLAIDAARVDTWGKYIIGFDDAKRATIARGLATQEQHDEAKRELERMKRDPETARRVLSGDADAMDKWTRYNLIASMRVAPADYDWSKDQGK
jgi:hypothetical protein